MGRGCRVFFVHFHSLPYTERASLELAEELVRQLALHHPSARLYFVPLGEIQRKIVTEAPAPLRVVLYRRYMLRLAALVAKKVHAKALVTGESLAQVASQTLDNIVTIEQAVSIPILRPLIGTGKEEIIAEARRLGTFEISIQPFDDCCSFLMPQRPETHAKLAEVLRAEERLGDMEPLLRDALSRTEELRIKLPPLHAGE
jgi:thiamine biosynthesis protein ThiI